MRKQNVMAVAAAWLAFGLDVSKTVFYRQSRIPQVTELTWYLSCYTPFPMLANAHSFKDKSDRLSDINAGLFTYPVLMAADVLLYETDLVPVGVAPDVFKPLPEVEKVPGRLVTTASADVTMEAQMKASVHAPSGCPRLSA